MAETREIDHRRHYPASAAEIIARLSPRRWESSRQVKRRDYNGAFSDIFIGRAQRPVGNAREPYKSSPRPANAVIDMIPYSVSGLDYFFFSFRVDSRFPFRDGSRDTANQN